MKLTYLSLLTAIGLTGGLCATANADDEDYSTERPASFFRDMEFDVDGFAIGTIYERGFDDSLHYFRHNVRYGAGAGGTFFFCRYLGIGGDFYTENSPGRFVAATSGNLVARYPIPHTCIAPYIYGGGGHQFDRIQQSFGQVGAGLEVRFARHFGMFVDGRYVVAPHTDNYIVGRAGVRLNF